MDKLSSKQKEFYQEVARVLWEKWDPIGVYEPNVDWDDEYDSYVPYIFSLAIEGKDAVSIASSLSAITTQNMGLSKNKSHDLDIAKIIVDIKLEMLG